MKTNAVALFLALFAASALQGPADAQQATPSAKEQRRTMATLRKLMISSLRDPESAKTKSEFLSWSNTSEAPVLSLCGFVNAKNGFGGYGGFQRYIVGMDGRVTMESSEPGSAMNYIWPIWCGSPV